MFVTWPSSSGCEAAGSWWIVSGGGGQHDPEPGLWSPRSGRTCGRTERHPRGTGTPPSSLQEVVSLWLSNYCPMLCLTLTPIFPVIKKICFLSARIIHDSQKSANSANGLNKNIQILDLNNGPVEPRSRSVYRSSSLNSLARFAIAKLSSVLSTLPA